MKKTENIATSMKQELIAMLYPDESKKTDIEEIKKLHTAARQKLKNQKLSKIEIQKILQDINTYLDEISSYKTLEIYIKAADSFENFCLEKLGTKQIQIEDCPQYIAAFIEWGTEKKLPPDIIHTNLAGICKALHLNIKDYINPKRISDKRIRGIYPTQDDDYYYNAIISKKVLDISKTYGLSRAELRCLKISDIHLSSEKFGSIHMEKENGQKHIRLVFGTEDISLLKSFIAEAEAEGRELLLTPEEMISDADLFHMRAMRVRDMYSIVCQDMQEHPEHREFYKREIQTIFAAKEKTLKENLDIPYRCHGKRRKKLIEMGKEPAFDRVAVLYVSCFVASHFRSSETIHRYLMK